MAYKFIESTLRENVLEHLLTLRDALLPRLMSGEVRVKDVEGIL